MPFLVAAVVLLAVLCLFNLLLLFAVLRRLRSHEERLADLPATRPPAHADLIGRSLPEFEAVTTAGGTLSRSEVAGRPRLVGVFSATCAPCHEQARAFAAHDDPDRIAVIAGPGGADDRRAMAGELGATPLIVTDAPGLVDGLGIRLFPTLLALDETGTVVRADGVLSTLVGEPAGV